MGKNNRARRAAKAKARARSQTRARGAANGQSTGANDPGFQNGPEAGPFGADAPRFSQRDMVRTGLVIGAEAVHDDGRVPPELLTQLCSMSSSVVDHEAESMLRDQVAAAWREGWQPAELARQGRLATANALGARLVLATIAADHAPRPPASLHPTWAGQIAALDLGPSTGRPGWLRSWIEREGIDRAAAVAAMIDVLAAVVYVPRMDVLLPPPGADAIDLRGPAPGAGAESDPLLERIRNLLAKAESTSFEAEATALTAKAQELMTRHAIDAAVLQAGGHGRGDAPVSIRVPVDAPYVDAKSLLLQTVAAAGRCRSVAHGGFDMSTVAGFPDDVAAVELLFTSLLVQAQAALAETARNAPPGTRTRSQSYRSAFLMAFTERIGDRLDEINRHVMDEVRAEQGTSFLPVLRSRSDEVEDYVAERFGEMTSAPVRAGYDRAGWVSGRLAADEAAINLAHLEHADPPEPRTRPLGELA